MLNLLVVGALSLAALEVSVQPLTGPVASGELIALSNDKLVLDTAEGEQVFDLNDLVAVIPLLSPRTPEAPAPIHLQLADGSLGMAKRYTVENGAARVELSNGVQIDLPLRAIDSVRWKTNIAAYDQHWNDIRDTDVAGDVVVVRKSESLDYYEGVLFDVSPETVQFEFDGSRIDVRSAKIEGVVYFHASGREFPETVCRVTEGDGSQWNAKSLLLADDHLELLTAAGVKLPLLLENIANLDFSLGKIVYLSDLLPISVDWAPYFGTEAVGPKLAQLFQPRNDRSFSGGQLTLNNKRKYAKGLALHSRATLVYRLPDNFRRLLADVGIDDGVREAGHVRLVISGDGQQLFEAELSGGDEQPLLLDLPIDGVRRLTILVDYGDGLDIGDHLNLCNARITK